MRRREPVLAPLDAALDELEESEGEWTARGCAARGCAGHRARRDLAGHEGEPDLLRFIEDERFDALPAAVYVRGFVTAYAGCLGLDAERVASGYMERYEERKGGAKRRLFSRK